MKARLPCTVKQASKYFPPYALDIGFPYCVIEEGKGQKIITLQGGAYRPSHTFQRKKFSEPIFLILQYNTVDKRRKVAFSFTRHNIPLRKA